MLVTTTAAPTWHVVPLIGNVSVCYIFSTLPAAAVNLCCFYQAVSGKPSASMLNL